jgi:phage gp36-like protein
MYAPLADLIDRYGERALRQLTDRGDVAAEAVDTALVERTIADASALADGYLRARLGLPLAAPPPALKLQVAAIAYHLLHGDRPTEESRKGYEGALAWLRDVAAGKVRLADEAPTPAAGEARMVAPDRTFSRGTLRGY